MASPALRLAYALLLAVPFFLLNAASASDHMPLDTVLIQDGDVTVTVADVEAVLAAMPPGRDRSQVSEMTVHQILDSLFLNRMIADELSPEQATEILASLPAAETADSDPVSEARLRQRREIVLARARLRELDAEVDMDGVRQLALERYTADRGQFRVPEQVRARHILIRLQDRTDEEALAQAQALHERLKDAPEQFAELAETHSEDPGSAARGGDLGVFGRGRMVPAFEEAAFSQTPGVVGEPVETRFGYHLILVEEHQPERQLAFDEVEGRLVEAALRERVQTLRADHAQAIRERPTATVHWDAVEQLVESLRHSSQR
ncbi:hypothetical protein CKO35_03970 [Ectothiorhodospira shaposhnikovii]|uniref:peptidylprolyl isomerase n=1 Tax=Ectothiorhodospira shaposhnikovii TaxID=1054 RepID=UPI001F5B9100|nr:peptidylprolyl isomerase [Ectothiorhodospira shaposhnikovii]MBK1672465.1 hypothetical protein [Ectothiorhodospira shaposhnikovii]